MNIYDFKKLEKCYVCGNIDKNMDRFIQTITSNLSNYEKKEHPKEIERQERVKNRANNVEMVEGPRLLRRNRVEIDWSKPMKKALRFPTDSTYNDSVIIVSGNCGIGSKSMKYYNEVFENLNKVLSANNCFILFLRGNNDDPSFFNELKIDYSNVKAIPDYSIVTLKLFNCLCIGGSVSLDKEWKLSQEEQFGKKLYWEGESPFFDEKTLDEILKKYQIGCVITSTSPSFTFPGTNAFNKSKWIKDNASIKATFSSERKILDKIYEKIVDGESKPYVWIYGRFKQANYSKVNDIIFDSLASFQIENIGELITRFFGIDLSKKLGGNVFTFDTFIAETESKFSMPIYDLHMDEPIAEGEERDVDEEVVEDVEEDVNPFGFEEPRLNNEPREVATNITAQANDAVLGAFVQTYQVPEYLVANTVNNVQHQNPRDPRYDNWE